MGLRGIIRGRTIELEQAPPLPDGTAVEVRARTADSLFEHLRALWRLPCDKPLPTLEQAREQAAQSLAPRKASRLIQTMRQK